MLAEGVIGHQERLFRAIRKHAVRPMDHRRLDEGKGLLPQLQAVAGLDRLKIPFPVITAEEPFAAPGGTEHLRLRTEF